MNRTASYVLMLATLVFSPVVTAADSAAADDAARQVAAAFLKALGGKNVEDAMKVSDAPFITDDQKVLTTKDAVRD